MTALQPRPHVRVRPGLLVVNGRNAARRRLGPWLTFSLVAVVAFLGMVLARTSLDKTAIELAAVEDALVEARSLNQRLRLEIARLESPARVAPLAEEMGMVYPQESRHLIVEGVVPQTMGDPRWADMDRFAASQPTEGTES